MIFLSRRRWSSSPRYLKFLMYLWVHELNYLHALCSLSETIMQYDLGIYLKSSRFKTLWSSFRTLKHMVCKIRNFWEKLLFYKRLVYKIRNFWICSKYTQSKMSQAPFNPPSPPRLSETSIATIVITYSLKSRELCQKPLLITEGLVVLVSTNSVTSTQETLLWGFTFDFLQI